MVMFYSAIPALMRGEQIKQKAGSVISVLHRVEHIRQFKEPVHMPFRIHLHAADIDTVVACINCRLQIIKGGLPRIEEQPLTRIIQRPRPGHVFTSHGFAPGLNPRDALHQTFGDPVLNFGAPGLGKANIVDRGHIICRRRQRLWHLESQETRKRDGSRGDGSYLCTNNGFCWRGGNRMIKWMIRWICQQHMFHARLPASFMP